MSVVLAQGRLRLELARRAWGCADLARAANLSMATVRSALAGRPIYPCTLRKIALALTATPPVREIDALLTSVPDRSV